LELEDMVVHWFGLFQGGVLLSMTSVAGNSRDPLR
jgi:hypothetical protein